MTNETYEDRILSRFYEQEMQNQLKKPEREELKKEILERRFEDDYFFAWLLIIKYLNFADWI